MKDSTLAVCDQCGWYEHGPLRPDECDPVAGEIVDKLTQEVCEVQSSKLGHGLRNFVFTCDPAFVIRFAVDDRARTRSTRPFSLREVWLLDSLSREAAADLVRVLVAWRKRWRGAR
jgi:hypothetical protein